MQRYKNIDGDSGVTNFEYDSNSIKVKFADGWIYTYDYASAGRANIEQMKRLADAGQGLNSYINTKVRKAYRSKER